jgi:hypothetical protein
LLQPDGVLLFITVSDSHRQFYLVVSRQQRHRPISFRYIRTVVDLNTRRQRQIVVEAEIIAVFVSLSLTWPEAVNLFIILVDNFDPQIA